MAKLGVPPTLVAVLKALHAKVNVKFSVVGVERTVPSVIGGRQGDLLEPILFNFHVAGALMAWKEERKSAPPALRTKCDFVLDRREWRKERVEGVVATVRVASCWRWVIPSTQTTPVSSSRLVPTLCRTYMPLLVDFFERFGLFVHVKLPGQKKPKSVLLYHEVPKASYSDYCTLDGEDFSDINIGGGRSIHVEFLAKYLGSVLRSNGKDDADVTARVKEATGAFASLKHCLFKKKDVTNEAKVAVYNSLVLSILLFGCESSLLTERLRNQLRTFHRRCVHDMYRLNMYVARAAVPHRHGAGLGEAVGSRGLGIRYFETYLVRQRLRWLGHVRRMPWHCLPRKLLTSWVCSPRMAGGQEMTYFFRDAERSTQQKEEKKSERREVSKNEETKKGRGMNRKKVKGCITTQLTAGSFRL
jgi:hypothetical protein